MHLGEYLKIILIKKEINGQGLSDLLNKQKGMNVKDTGNATVTRHQVSYWINGTEKISPLMARRIELALDLNKGTLLRFTQRNGNNMQEYNKVFGEEEGES